VSYLVESPELRQALVVDLDNRTGTR